MTKEHETQILEAALIGFQLQAKAIDAKIAELRTQLAVRTNPAVRAYRWDNEEWKSVPASRTVESWATIAAILKAQDGKPKRKLNADTIAKMARSQRARRRRERKEAA